MKIEKWRKFLRDNGRHNPYEADLHALPFLRDSLRMFNWLIGWESTNSKLSKAMESECRCAIAITLAHLKIQGQPEGIYIWQYDRIIATIPWKDVFTGNYSMNNNHEKMSKRINTVLSKVKPKET